ncbi:MAG: hydroxymethylbilane synthase, partial [Pseudomonadota bacterium]
AVAAGEFDIAIHSGKDLPFRVFSGTEYLSILPRETPNDVFIPRSRGDTVSSLRPGAVIGTNSNRRRANLRSVRPDLAFADYAGNITTRILSEQMEKNRVDGIVMAAAGLRRLGLYDAGAMQLLPNAECLPAANQGILAAQMRAGGDEKLAAAARTLQHRETAFAWRAERSFLEAFDAGCDTPISVFADFTGARSATSVVLRARVPQKGGAACIAFEQSSSLTDGGIDALDAEADTLGRALADRVNAAGARETIATPDDFA